MNTKRIWPCLFGLRCARLVAEPHEGYDLPEGMLLQVEYVCAGCNTRYRGNGWRRKKVKDDGSDRVVSNVFLLPRNGHHNRTHDRF